MSLLVLPDEVLLLISELLDPADILKLLGLNWRLHNIFEPLYYREVDLTRSPATRLSDFVESISIDHGRKGILVNTLKLDYIYQSPELKLFPNLRRLGFTEERNFSFIESWKTFSNISGLTHFTCMSQIFHHRAFATFLKAQTHLQF